MPVAVLRAHNEGLPPMRQSRMPLWLRTYPECRLHIHQHASYLRYNALQMLMFRLMCTPLSLTFEILQYTLVG